MLPNEQQLSYGKMVLQDSQTLEHYGIKKVRFQVRVSANRGTPKSSISMGLSINYKPSILDTPIYGNPRVVVPTGPQAKGKGVMSTLGLFVAASKDSKPTLQRALLRSARFILHGALPRQPEY